MTETLPDYAPDLSSIRTREPKILRAEFGDGYFQATGDGINPYRETWEMNYSNRPAEHVDAIKDFLDTHNGVVSFYWTPPGETALTPNPKKWVQIGAYSEGKSGPETKSISFKLERVQTL